MNVKNNRNSDCHLTKIFPSSIIYPPCVSGGYIPQPYHVENSHTHLSDPWSLTNPTAFNAFGEEWQILDPPPPIIQPRAPAPAQTPIMSKKRKPHTQPQAQDTSHAQASQASQATQNTTPERGDIKAFLKEALATAL